MKTTLGVILAIAATLPLFGADKPVATIGSAAISQADLDTAVGDRLIRIRTDEYNIRRAALDEMISTKLIAAEAARRHITAEELLRIEVEQKIAQPNPAEIEPVYDGVADRYPAGMTKEQVLAEIADGMRHQRILTRRLEFVRQLRVEAGVRIHLAPPRAAVKAEGPSRGDAHAPVTIVEFSDFECPYCGRSVETLQKVEKTYGDKVRIVFRDYPLQIHRTAKRAAEAAHCADDQGKFWQMHDRLFSKGGALTDGDISRFAVQASLDREKFEACLSSGKYRDAWKTSQEEGTRVGVSSTPTFFINGRMLVGAATFDAFARVIEEELAGQPATIAAR